MRVVLFCRTVKLGKYFAEDEGRFRSINRPQSLILSADSNKLDGAFKKLAYRMLVEVGDSRDRCLEL